MRRHPERSSPSHVIVICDGCGAERHVRVMPFMGVRDPRGWQRVLEGDPIEGKLYCTACKRRGGRAMNRDLLILREKVLVALAQAGIGGSVVIDEDRAVLVVHAPGSARKLIFREVVRVGVEPERVDYEET